MDNEILTIEEVAKYLRVSERTVYEWVQKGEIPCGKIGSNWRFKKSELERWVDDRLMGKKKKDKSGESLLISSVLSLETCSVLDCSDKKEALAQMVSLLSVNPAIKDKNEVLEAVFKREELMSTGIGLHIGVPHVRLDSVSSIAMAAGVNKHDIEDYESLDGQPVRIIIMLAAGRNQHTEYIRMLSTVSAKLKQPSVRDNLLSASDGAEIFSILTSSGALS